MVQTLAAFLLQCSALLIAFGEGLSSGGLSQTLHHSEFSDYPFWLCYFHHFSLGLDDGNLGNNVIPLFRALVPFSSVQSRQQMRNTFYWEFRTFLLSRLVDVEELHYHFPLLSVDKEISCIGIFWSIALASPFVIWYISTIWEVRTIPYDIFSWIHFSRKAHFRTSSQNSLSTWYISTIQISSCKIRSTFTFLIHHLIQSKSESWPILPLVSDDKEFRSIGTFRFVALRFLLDTLVHYYH